VTSHHPLCGDNWGRPCNCPVENELRTSNLGVCPKCGGPFGAGSYHEEDRCQEIQIERLRAERDVAREALRVSEARVRELSTPGYHRLRAALEQFKKAGDPEGTANQRWMFAIASQALDGSTAVETTAKHPACICPYESRVTSLAIHPLCTVHGTAEKASENPAFIPNHSPCPICGRLDPHTHQ
jgi:hypothetical protein